MTGSTGRRGPYAGTAERKTSILDVAWEVFATQGYRGGSLREISARLGFSEAGVLHHFGSKQKLLLEVLSYREALNAPSETATGLGLLEQLRTVVQRNAETPGAVQLFVTMSAEATDPAHPAHQFFVDRYRGTQQLFAAALSLGRLDGELSEGLDPVVAARQLIAFLDGIQVQWLLSPDFDMASAYDRYVEEFRTLYAARPTPTTL